MWGRLACRQIGFESCLSWLVELIFEYHFLKQIPFEYHLYSHHAICPKNKKQILFHGGDMYRKSTKKYAKLAYTFFTIYSESNLKRIWLKIFLYPSFEIYFSEKSEANLLENYFLALCSAQNFLA